jgi:DNA-binding PadR family transcriptional regulator
VRAATLILLAEQPMHGYQLMQAMAERTNGVWRPSPGAIYPTIAQLEDEGLVTTLAEGGRKLVTLTDAGRAHLADNAETLADPFAALIGTPGQNYDLRSALEEIHIAARILSRNATEAQAAAAHAVLTETRRSLYLILADGAASGSPAKPTGPAEPAS